jgi:tyrosyl-tRNA synthetase
MLPGLIELAARHTVARMLERDHFRKRYAEGRPISIHEFLYRWFRAMTRWRSRRTWSLAAPIRNSICWSGRQLQQAYGQKPQVVMTTAAGGAGWREQDVQVARQLRWHRDPPEEMFGRLMSISDDLMWRYFELLSFRPLAELGALKREVEQGRNPRDVKFDLAVEIVSRFHGAAGAEAAKAAFIARHRDRSLPENLPLTRIAAPGGRLGIAHLLKAAGLVVSTSEAIRLLGQGGVRIDGERVDDRSLEVEAGREHIYQVGKRRFARVLLEG